MSNWERYSRMGVSAASTVSSVGFSAAKLGTSVGFGIARGVTSTAVSIAGYPFGVGPLLGGAVSIAFSLAEQVALAPILLGESLTSTTLVAAESSIDVLSAIFPGSDEASFSLASFVSLVRRQWNEPSYLGQFPPERYSVREIATALVAWGALQGVTHAWKEKNWFSVLKEINVNDIEDDCSSDSGTRERKESRIRITSDLTRRNVGQIITAEIEDVEPPSERTLLPLLPTRMPSRSDSFVSQIKLKSNLRRLSKMVLAGYGGAGLLFFGVSLSPPPPPPGPEVPNPLHSNANTPEEHLLADTVDASEREASSTIHHPAPAPESPPRYSWWNVLLGRHDREIFEGYAFASATMQETPSRRWRHSSKTKEKGGTAIIGTEKRMPRFWVLTDHGRKQVVLVLRGTMSLNELAVDLTCEPVPFSLASPDDPLEDVSEVDQRTDEDITSTMPGALPFPSVKLLPSGSRLRTDSNTSSEASDRETHYVHCGILRLAQVMGAKGQPVHRAVQEALYKNRGYELILTGHSLGAGVAALLALTWANPETCLTVLSSGLPVGRRVSAYCFAPPCLVSSELSNLSRKLITSFTYSHDVVSRLSLGSVRDMNAVAAWLCEANKGGNEEGYPAVTKRALKWRAGYGRPEDPDWFLSVRKTLEANMMMADLFPPGRVLWAVRDGDLHPSHRLPTGSRSSGSETHPEDKVRLFEVLDVEKMFGQIVFARDMLSSHLPHQYDRVLHELL